MRVGTIVRVDLQGRRVRGWVTELDPAPFGGGAGADELRSISKVSSAGPPAHVMALCDEVARRWVGRPALVLRIASPHGVVDPATTPGATRPGPGFSVRLVVRPPGFDRRELISSLLAESGSTIVVVPDAARAEAFAREAAAAGRTVAALGSRRSDRERTRAWATAFGGDGVVVGGRTAVFAPVPDLARVVVLDEADEALTEERQPTWSARDVAALRCRDANAELVMVTPAPTVDAWELADREVDRAPVETERRGWPRVEVIDPGESPPGRRLLTDDLMAAIRAEVAAGRRTVCVLNRTGRARLLVCDTCAAVARCEHCGAAVRESGSSSGGDSALHCDRCGKERPRICAQCHGTVLRTQRLGVSRVRDDLAGLLGDTPVDEVDATTSDVPTAPVVIGTEAALHRVRGNVGLVAFLEFDQELLAPRARATEQAMWLLVRSARLVGGRRGRLLLQTRIPDHDVVRSALDADPTALLPAEAQRREALRFPPFGGLAALGGNEQAVALAADTLRTAGGDVLGPVDGRALVRAASADALADLFATTDLSQARAAGRLRIEVDPLRV